MKVDIWSDVVCPWCYVGKRRLEAALARFPHRDEVQVVWRAFELDPAAPAERTGSYAEHLAAKYRTELAGAEQMIRQMTDAGAAVGLDLRFDLARSGNTADAHRLLHLAAERGRQGELAERLFRAYFTEGQPIGSAETLLRLATEVGLDADDAWRVLDSDAYADAVRAEESAAADIGIHAVPFFVVDRRYAVAGAQPPDVLLEVLQRAWAERAPVPVVAGGADPDGCADGSCAV